MAVDCNFVAALCKGVNETARLGIDFIDLIAAGETLNDPPTVTVSPSGPTVSGQDIVAGAEGGLTAAAALVAGGTAGTTYKVWFAVTTSGGQTRKKYLSMDVDAE